MGLAGKQRIPVQLLAVTLHIASQPANTFDPRVALGAGIDGHEEGEIAQKLTTQNINRMRSAGLKPLAYRLRTELAGEAWHWTAEGTWSDAAHSQGYWIGRCQPGHCGAAITNGYRLPRRGNTIDQANNDGYSRIDDGDAATYWKSNPYLADRPQWIAVDFGREERVNTVRIQWGEPRATSFRYEYSDDEYPDLTSSKDWEPLPDDESTKLRWLRVVLEASSHTGPPSADLRDRTGFAIGELAAGFTDSAGVFTDKIRHGAARQRQTPVYVSSTDPWHRATDRDPDIEQPSLDFSFQSGLSNGLPVLMPAPVLYDTPENSAALFGYLHQEAYPVTDIELGEEPEEQFAAPEDFAALARLHMAAIRAQAIPARFGGPSLILLAPKLVTDANWMGRFYRALPSLEFFSFEWYPFDDICGNPSKQLAESAELFQGALQKIKAAGVPRSLPWYMTEYGYSAYGAQAEVDLPGALFNAEAVALFLTSGGTRTYLYGYEPGELLHDRRCSYGNNMILFNDSPTATYWAAKLLAESWAAPQGGQHLAFRATTGNPLVGAYALRQPSGTTAILLINKSPGETESMASPFAGPFTVTRFSAAQYEWRAAGENSRAIRSLPPARSRQESGPVTLLPYSLTVIAGNLPETK